MRVLNYCVTSNHVHILARPGTPEELGRLMQYVSGGFAQEYNRRKSRAGAFWTDQYHATMIEDGDHLWRCMRYIDLNMVRAGAVRHPREWEWSGWGELMGERRRNRIVSMEAVLESLGASEVDAFRSCYRAFVETALKGGDSRRESCWSEAVAVGGAEYVAEVERELTRNYRRKELETEEETSGIWVLREAENAYARETSPKNRSIPPFSPPDTDATI